MSKFPKACIIDAETGVVAISPRKKKVGIVVGGRTRNEAPYDDPDWLFYGLNELPQERAEIYFEMHPMEVQNAYELGWLEKCEVPVYLLELDDRVPYGVKYPLEAVLEATGARRYFTSTFAYQVALAIYEGFDEIGLWGLPLFHGSPREQTIERICLEYWLGFAEGKGIKVTTHPDDKLLWQPHLYGYDYWEEKRHIEGMMAHLGRDVHTKQRHLNEDGGGPTTVGGDNWGFV